MIKHIVLWKFKDFAGGATKAQNIDEVERRLNELKAELSIIKGMTFLRNAVQSDANFDAGVELLFDSREDLAYYQDYPKHRELSAFSSSVRTERALLDAQMH